VRVGGERPASGAGQKIQEDLMATTVHQTGRRIALDERKSRRAKLCRVRLEVAR
jgi:hypothetical protein